MKNKTVLFLGLMLLCGISADKAPFSTQLFHEIVEGKHNENVIVSPASIWSCLGLAFMGAGGTTARELYNTLNLSGDSKDEVGQRFLQLSRKINNSGVDLKTANRIYLAERYSLAPKYEELITKYLGSTAEKINFADSVSAAQNINSWVEAQTNNKIHDLVSVDSIDASTSAILLNAVYFKATWKYEFNVKKVRNMDFFSGKDKVVSVKMMQSTLNIPYAELAQLNAKAVEIPYSNTDIHMLIVLPNEIDGLSAVEEKLTQIPLTSIQLQNSKINLKLPKFKIDFETSLNHILKKMGLERMFTNGDFNEITSTHAHLDISNVQHKAFIEVDEHGTEAAAATSGSMSRTLPSPRDFPLDFIVNHPFFFAIKDRDNVYFAGHIVKF